VPTFKCGLVRSNFSLLMLLLRFLYVASASTISPAID
jgi:hypothetical protein